MTEEKKKISNTLDKHPFGAPRPAPKPSSKKKSKSKVNDIPEKE